MSAKEKPVPIRVEGVETDHWLDPSDRSRNPVQQEADISSDLERLVVETIMFLAAEGIAIEDMPPLVRLKDTVLEKYVVEAIASLATMNIADSDMAPLIRLKDVVKDLNAGGASGSSQEPKRGYQPASEPMLARACAIIDLLIRGGQTPEEAAQITARHFLAAGVGLPEKGGDSRGWKRLLNWRARLKHGVQPDNVQAEYLRFTDEIAKIPPKERITRVLGHGISDARTSSSRYRLMRGSNGSEMSGSGMSGRKHFETGWLVKKHGR